MARIAHVISTPSGLGGAERVLLAIAGEGHRRGLEQVILNPFAVDPTRSALADSAGPVPVVGRSCRTILNLPGLRKWLSAAISGFRPDVVHAHLFHGLLATASVQTPGATRVLTHHHGGYFAAENRRFAVALDRWGGSRFDHVAAVSEAAARFIRVNYRYPSSKVSVIRNGWAGCPVAHTGSDSGHTIVSVGNLRAEKGQDVLIDAFASLLSEFPDARLVLVGDGPMRSRLEDAVRSLGIGSHVIFAGAVNEPWSYLSKADAFAAPSRSEALGIAVIEAMAAGLPVVASNVGGLPELVQDGVTGYLVPPGDDRVLTESLGRLLRDSSTRHRMASAGRRAAESLKMETMCDSYFELYERLMVGGTDGE